MCYCTTFWLNTTQHSSYIPLISSHRISCSLHAALGYFTYLSLSWKCCLQVPAVLLFETHQKHQAVSVWYFHHRWKRDVSIFNLTATLLFLDSGVQTIWPPVLVFLKKKKKSRNEKSGSCLCLLALHKPMRTKAKLNLAISQGPCLWDHITALITGSMCGKIRTCITTLSLGL